MKIYKKILFPSIIGTSLLLFSACATADTQPYLEILQSKVEFSDALNDMAREYEEETGIKILVTTAGGGAAYRSAITTKFRSGTAPSIFHIEGPPDVLTWESKLADLSDTKAASLANSGTLEPVTKDNKILGLPLSQEGYGLIYNKKIFADAGINPDSITNFKQLEDAVKLLDSKKEELDIEAVFAFPAKETWVTGLHTLSPVIEAELGDINDVFNSKEIELKYANQYKQIIDLQNDYSVQPTITLDYSMQVEQLFSLGKVAMIQQGNWVYLTIEAIDPEFAKNNIGMIPLQYENLNENTLPVGVPTYWSVNADKSPEEQQMSKDFLDWIYTSETGMRYVLEEFKFIPPYSGYDLDKIYDPLSKDVYKYSLNNQTSRWVFTAFPANFGDGVAGNEIQKYVEGKVSWEEVIETMKTSWAESRK